MRALRLVSSKLGIAKRAAEDYDCEISCPSDDTPMNGVSNLYSHFAGRCAERGEFFFWGEVTDGQCELASLFLRYSLLSGKKMVTLFITSPGGSTDDVRALTAQIELCKQAGMIVRTYGSGLVASAALDLFLSGTKGYRFAFETTMFMTHASSGVVTDKAMYDLQCRFDKWTYEKYTTLSTRDMNRFLSTGNWWFDAAQAIEYGMLDAVVRVGESMPEGPVIAEAADGEAA